MEQRREGRLSSLAFTRAVDRQRTLKTLSRRQTIVSSFDRANNNHSNCITSLHIHPVETRFLLTGSSSSSSSSSSAGGGSSGRTIGIGQCTIYDLSRFGAEPLSSLSSSHSSTNTSSSSSSWFHKPIAQTNPATLLERPTPLLDGAAESPVAYVSSTNSQRRHQLVGPVTSVQWYPTDSGAFLSSHVSGALCLWDTNSMTAVLQVHPFAASPQLRGTDATTTMPALTNCETTSHHPSLVAVTSLHVPTVKLVDLRSGAAAHSLTGHVRGGVTTVAWSPTTPHVLATGGTDATVRLWDIRKAGRHAWIGGGPLNGDVAATSIRMDRHDPLVRTPYRPDYSHLNHHRPSRQNLQSTKTAVVSPRSLLLRRQGGPSGRQRQIRERPVGPNDYTQAAHVTSHGNHRVHAVAFLPSGHGLVSVDETADLKLWDLAQGQVVPRTFGGITTSARNRQSVAPCLLKTSTASRTMGDDAILWMARGLHLYQFNAHTGGAPQQRLVGHLKRIHAMDMCPDTGKLVTGGTDGLVLVWDSSSSADVSSPLRMGRKRKQVQVDRDTW